MSPQDDVGEGAARRRGEEEQEELLDLLQRRAGTRGSEESSAVNTIRVLDMINSLQQEIKEINSEIEKENRKIEQLQTKPLHADRGDDELEAPVRTAAKVSTEETVKELTLQKEDTTMKKVISAV